MIGRLLKILSLTLMALLLVQHAAMADTPANNVDPNDITEGQGTQPSSGCPNFEAGHLPDEQNVTYKTYWSPPLQTNLNLGLDIYDPRPGGSGTFSAIVVSHGGGWKVGCRRSMAGFSWNAAGKNFIVFAIDYRLTCIYGQPDLNVLCGSASNPFTFANQPTDVKDAIQWVRNNAQAHLKANQTFSGKVVAVGGSAGGSITFMAGDTGTVGGTRPDLMAGFSPVPELGYMSDGNTACSVAYPNPGGVTLCTNNTTDYMAGALTGTGQCGDSWAAGSPACNVNGTSLPPPTFMANATDDLVAYKAATDLQFKLDTFGVTEQLCTIGNNGPPWNSDSHLHGTQLIDKTCPATGKTVFQSLFDFISLHL
ncbi:MAG TPA: alpha/beta hydrolase [Gemmatimonadales bacterium]